MDISVDALKLSSHWRPIVDREIEALFLEFRNYLPNYFSSAEEKKFIFSMKMLIFLNKNIIFVFKTIFPIKSVILVLKM